MSLRNITVPAGVYNLSAAGPATAVNEYKDGVATGKQTTDDNGVAVWRVPVLIATSTEIVQEVVKVASNTEPVFALNTPLVYDELTITPMGNRNNPGSVSLYFSAGSLAAPEKARS